MIKYGIFETKDNNWFYPTLISELGLDPSSYTGPDGRFETTDINLVFRYMENQRKRMDIYSDYMEARERQ